MSVRRAQDEIDSREFAEWLAYGSIDPYSDERFDVLIAMMTAQISNMLRGKGQRAFRLEDFMPFREKRKQSAQEIQSVFMAFAKRHNEQLEAKP